MENIELLKRRARKREIEHLLRLSKMDLDKASSGYRRSVRKVVTYSFSLVTLIIIVVFIFLELLKKGMLP